MDQPDDGPPRAALDEHSAFVRRVCARLVHERETADDVAQETWLSFLRRPPRTDVPLAPWLMRVARNHVLQRRRSEGRRAQRELHVARDASAASAASLVEREMVRRAVCEALRELGEPHRTTLVLRFFEDLPPREVAARLGVPVETVRSRTRRGLELLRVRLGERARGRESTWAFALLALAGDAPRASPWRALSPSRVAAYASACIASVACIAVLALLPWRSDRVPRRAEPSTVHTRALVAKATSTASDSVLAADRVPVEARAELELRVVHARSGAPLVAAHVIAEPHGRAALEALTDACGAVVFELPVGVALRLRRVATRDTRGAECELATDWAAAARAGRVVVENVALPGGYVSGSVVDSVDAPVEGAAVFAFAGAPSFRGGEPVDVIATAATDANGRFELVDIPLPFSVIARARDDGASWSQLAPYSESTARAELRLRESHRVRGRIVDAAGIPVAAASVFARAGVVSGRVDAIERIPAWMCRTESDARGEFELCGLPRASVALSVRHAEFAERRIELAADATTLELALARGASAQLRVLDASGAPVRGASVRLCSARGACDARTTDAEGRAAFPELGAGERAFWRVDAPGHAVHVGQAWTCAEIGRRDTVVLAPSRELEGRVVDARGRPIPSMWVSAARDAGAGWELAVDDASARVRAQREVASAWSDGEGRFRLVGLEAIEYVVEARATPSGAVHALATWSAGAGKLELAPGARAPRASWLHGRVVLADGRAADSFRVRARAADALVRPIRAHFDAARGEFELLLPCGGRWSLLVDADGTAVQRRDVAIDGARVEAEFRLSATHDVRVRVVDVDGAPLSGADVAARGVSSARESGVPPIRGVLDARGEIALLRVPEGRLELVVRAVGSTRKRHAEVPAEPAADGVYEVRVGARTSRAR